jgi:hypothetical protein
MTASEIGLLFDWGGISKVSKLDPRQPGWRGIRT